MTGLSRYLPMPWVGIAAVLAALIVLTPVFLHAGPPAAGTLLTQANLVVDLNTSSSPVTFHFYLWGATPVRYVHLAIGVVDWGGQLPPVGAAFRWTNASGAVGLSAGIANATVAINVSADYVTTGGAACYAGVLGLSFRSTAMGLALRSFTPGLVVPTTVPLARLPLTIALPFVSVPSAGGGGCAA